MKIFCLLALILSACNPLDDVRTDCREIADEALMECVAFYEEVAIPAIEEQLDETLLEIQAWFEAEIALLRAELEQALLDKKIEILTELGCTETMDNSFGWTCTETVICK